MMTAPKGPKEGSQGQASAPPLDWSDELTSPGGATEIMIERSFAIISNSPRTFGARNSFITPSGRAAAPLATGHHLPRLRRSTANSATNSIAWITISFGMIAAILVTCCSSTVQAKDDNFSDAVKVIERFYRVKHKGIPFLARAGMKTAVTAARIAGGPKRRLAEAGSVKVAYFEDQDFSSANGVVGFRAAINAALGATWSPLIQVVSPQADEQVYIFLRETGEKFQVLVITIDRRDASVIQVTLSPSSLAKLMQDPNDMGRAINEEATSDE